MQVHKPSRQSDITSKRCEFEVPKIRHIRSPEQKMGVKPHPEYSRLRPGLELVSLCATVPLCGAGMSCWSERRRVPESTLLVFSKISYIELQVVAESCRATGTSPQAPRRPGSHGSTHRSVVVDPPASWSGRRRAPPSRQSPCRPRPGPGSGPAYAMDSEGKRVSGFARPVAARRPAPARSTQRPTRLTGPLRAHAGIRMLRGRLGHRSRLGGTRASRTER